MSLFFTRACMVFGFIKKVLIHPCLTTLAKKYKTDKWGEHSYTLHYEKHFKKFEYSKVKLLEIGVGGYDDPEKGGNSLRMWKEFFPLGSIYSIDIFDKSKHIEDRIAIYKGDQTDSKFINKTFGNREIFDIIVDDGSHVNSHVIASFKILFPLLKKGGIYVIEDLQTSYWKEFGGGFESPNTSINFCKRLVDCLNYAEFPIKDYEPNYFDKNIISIQFYHNMVFIYKNDNIEKSNIIKNGEFK